MSVEVQGTRRLDKTCPSATLSTINSPRTTLEVNSGLSSGKSSTARRLSVLTDEESSTARARALLCSQVATAGCLLFRASVQAKRFQAAL